MTKRNKRSDLSGQGKGGKKASVIDVGVCLGAHHAVFVAAHDHWGVRVPMAYDMDSDGPVVPAFRHRKLYAQNALARLFDEGLVLLGKPDWAKSVRLHITANYAFVDPKLAKTCIGKAVKQVGAKMGGCVDEPALIGGWLAMQDGPNKYNAVVDLGHHKSQIYFFEKGKVVATAPTQADGLSLTRALQTRLSEGLGFAIPYAVAEDLKREKAFAGELGLNDYEAMCRASLIKHAHSTAAREYVQQVIDEQSANWAETLSSDINHAVMMLEGATIGAVQTQGIHLIGGAAALKGLASTLAVHTGLSFHVSNRPEDVMLEAMKWYLEG